MLCLCVHGGVALLIQGASTDLAILSIVQTLDEVKPYSIKHHAYFDTSLSRLTCLDLKHCNRTYDM